MMPHLFKSMRLLLTYVLIIFILLRTYQEQPDSAKISNAMHGWEFRSYLPTPNFLSNSKNHKILIISLIDGSLMAVDSDTGAIFWTIKESETFLSRQCVSFGCYFYHSTGDQVYFLADGLAHLVTSDTFGWIKLKKLLNIVNSYLDVVTLGINVLTGKFYFFSSSQSCLRNSTDQSNPGTLENLLIVKRTRKIVQIFDMDSQQEILKLATVSHDISSYHFDKENLAPPKTSSNLNYDINNHVLYCHENDGKSESTNCWSISFNSPISKIWQITKTSTHFTVLPLDLLNIISVNHVKISKIFDQRSSLISSKYLDKSCNKHLIQIYFNEYTFLQNVGLNFDQNCFYQPIISTLNISNISQIKTRFSKREFLLKPFKKSVKYASKMTFISKYIGNYVTGIKHLRFISQWKLFNINKNVEIDLNFDGKIFNEVRPRKRIAAKKFLKEFVFTLVCVGIILFLVYLFIHQYQLKYHPNNEIKSFVEDTISIGKKRSFKKQLFRDPEESDSAESSECQLLTPTLFSRYSSEFQHLKNIGVGGYGVVFKARNYMDKCVYAVKRITVSDCIWARERTIREVQALAQLNHPGIIRFYAAWFEQATDREFQKLSKRMNGKKKFNINCQTNSRSMVTETNTIKSEDTDIIFEYDSKHPRPTSPLWNESIDGSNDLRRDSHSDRSTDKTVVVTCRGKHGCQHLQSVYLYIQMELCHKETLRSFLMKKPLRNTPTVISIFEQILNAVKYFHSRNLMHRDLKPSNIFFSFEGCVKIGDFGLVTRFNFDQSRDSSVEVEASDDDTNTIDTVTKLVGTELYMAPELVEKRSYDFKVDIYSLGLVFFELLVPFYSQYHRALVLTKVKELNFPPECKNLSNDSIEIIKLMLSYNPDARPSVTQLLQMDLMSKILSVAEPLDEAKQKIVTILSEIHDIHIYSDCSI